MPMPARRGLLGFILESSELPGERALPALLAQARRAGAEDAWASRRLEWLRRDLEGEKAALTRVFPATVLVFWTLALLTERDTRNKNLWTMLPLNGALTIGIGLRIWLCNRLLRRFWVDGILVRIVGSRPMANNVTMRLLVALSTYVTARGLGQVTPPDAVYDFENTSQKDTGLLPDVGFYRAERESLVDPDAAYPFAPDLAVEIASPKQYRSGMKAKAARYLAGGTSLVWVVWPKRRQVDVWHHGSVEPTTLHVGDTLDGEDVVPGFTYAVADLFV